MLSGDDCAIAPVTPAVGDLAQGIVAVNPIASVGQGVLDGLVGVVVGIVERNRHDTRSAGLRRNLRQPIQIIILLAGRHPRHAVGLKGNLAHQRRIGKVGIRR